MKGRNCKYAYVCKIETASMISYERRNIKYAQLGKRKLQVCVTMKIETASMLNNENRNCKYYFNCESRNYKYAKLWK